MLKDSWKTSTVEVYGKPHIYLESGDVRGRVEVWLADLWDSVVRAFRWDHKDHEMHDVAMRVEQKLVEKGLYGEEARPYSVSIDTCRYKAENNDGTGRLIVSVRVGYAMILIGNYAGLIPSSVQQDDSEQMLDNYMVLEPDTVDADFATLWRVAVDSFTFHT